jgi:hypothetical protein
MPDISKSAFWLLHVQDLTKDDEAIVRKQFNIIGTEIVKHQKKVPFFVGFFGRILGSESRLIFYEQFQQFFAIMTENIGNSSQPAYKISLMMLAAFLRNWTSESEIHNARFKVIIEPFVKTVLCSFRGLEQEY